MDNDDDEEEGEEFELNVIADSNLEPEQLDVKQYYEIRWGYRLENCDADDPDLKLFSDALFLEEKKQPLTSDKLRELFVRPAAPWTFYMELISTLGVGTVMRRALETKSWELVEWIVEHRDPGYTNGLALVLELAPKCPTSTVELMLEVVTGKYKCKAPMCKLMRCKCPKHGNMWKSDDETLDDAFEDTCRYAVDLLFMMRSATTEFPEKLKLVLVAIDMKCENILANLEKK